MTHRLLEDLAHESRGFLDTLTPREKEIALDILREMSADPEYGKMKSDYLWEIDYRERPVDIETFITNDEYLGTITEEFYPKWVDELKIVFAPGSKYFEWLFGGAIGTGKSTIATLANVYVIYKMSLLRNPHKYYRLAPTSNIVFGIYSITKTQALDVGYFKVKNYLDSSPYFKKKFPRVTRLETRVQFKNHPMQVMSGCLAEGTLISTPSGKIPIENLANSSDEVMTWNSQRLVATKYSGVKYTGYKKCLDIKSSLGYNILCSESHKILTEDSYGNQIWKAAKELKEGETLFVLQEDEADLGFLPESETSDEPMQGVSQEKEQHILSQDKNLPGQEIPFSNGRNEDLQTMRSGEVGTGVWDEEDSNQDAWDKIIPPWELQILRCGDSDGLVREEYREACQIRPEQAFYPAMEKTGEKTLRRILRYETQGDSRSVGVAGGSRLVECASKKVAWGEFGEMPNISATGEGSQPRSLSGFGKNKERRTERSNATVGKEVVGGGRSFHDGLLPEWLCLLWKRRDKGRDARSYSSTIKGIPNDSCESCTVLSKMQQSEECETRSGVRLDARQCLGGNRSNCKICRDRVETIKDAGILRTWDVIEVPSTHLVISNGVLTGNSKEFHALGMDLFSLYLDEVNFMTMRKSQTVNVDPSQAYGLYNTARGRLKSRFMRPGGQIPGMMFLLSSKQSTQSFLEKHAEECRKEIAEGKVRLTEFSQWDVKDKRIFTMPHFKVEIGDQMFQSRVLPEDASPRVGADLLDVPGEYRVDFEKDVEQALRDIAGVATYGLAPFLRNKDALLSCVDETYKHPFTREEITIDVKDDTQLTEYFLPKEMFRVFRSAYHPHLNPGAPRFAHLDLGLVNDPSGLCIGHVSGFKTVKRIRPDGTFYEDQCPHIIIDLMLRIKPPYQSEIDISKIRSFLISLKDMGMPILRVSADGWQSSDFKQILNKVGFDCIIHSVDKNDESYLYLRQSILESRITYYRYEPFFKEVLNLERDLNSHTVDHPKHFPDGSIGTKDVSDAVAGVVFHCMTDERAYTTGTIMSPIGQDIGDVTLDSVTSRVGMINLTRLARDARR